MSTLEKIGASMLMLALSIACLFAGLVLGATLKTFACGVIP